MDDVSQFIGRDADIEAIWEALRSRSLLVVGPRRIGKTELLKHMADKPPERAKAVFIDLQGAQTVDAAFARTLDALKGAGLEVENPLADRLQKAQLGGSGVDFQRAARPTEWEALEALIQGTFKNMAKTRTPRLVLLIDEVPWWLDALRKTDPAGARTALARLRYLRQVSPDLRIVLTGSIGLAGLAQEVGASAEINDLLPVTTLGPLSAIAGRGLFEATLARRGRSATPEAAAEAAEIAGGSPHWIRELADKATGPRVTDDVLRRSVEALLSPQNRAIFADEGHEHLVRRHGAVRARTLRAMLDAAARDPAGVDLDTLLTVALSGPHAVDSRGDAKQLVFLLLDEFYLRQDGNHYLFALPLFRLWWERYGDLT